MCLLAAANILYTVGRKLVRIKGSHFVRRNGMEKENLVSLYGVRLSPPDFLSSLYFKLHYINGAIYSVKQYFKRPFTQPAGDDLSVTNVIRN